MSRVWVKICGVTDGDALAAAVLGGADAVGLVFAPSSRRVSIPLAQELAGRVSPGIERVAVFVDEGYDGIARVVDTVPLERIQLHGSEPPELCHRLRCLGLQVTKAVRVGRDEAAVRREAARYAGAIDSLLLDTLVGDQAGGTGRSFDWTAVPRFKAAVPGLPIMLAGGLKPGNVARALETAQADGIDVSSGVERAGRKEPELITSFITKVRRWEQRAATG